MDLPAKIWRAEARLCLKIIEGKNQFVIVNLTLWNVVVFGAILIISFYFSVDGLHEII